MGHADKQDTGKIRWGLMPWDALREVCRVFMFGALKYSDNGWKIVPDAEDRYWDAAIRHLVDWKTGVAVKDKESGLPTLAHAAADVLILLALEMTREGINASKRFA